MADVYISFSTKDVAVACQIKKELEGKGLSCYLSCGEIEAGKSNPNFVYPEILNAKTVVFLVSRNAMESPVAKNELYQAALANRPIFPVRLDNAPLNDTISFYLGTRQWINAKRRLVTTSAELYDTICTELYQTNQKPESDTMDQTKINFQKDKDLGVRLLAVVGVIVAYMVILAISFANLRESNLGLYWKYNMILSVVAGVGIIFICAPAFGGYKVFLRTITEKIRDAFRGK